MSLLVLVVYQWVVLLKFLDLESSGKTTLTLSVIAQAQKVGKTCAFIDAEHALDPVLCSKTWR